MCTVSFLPEPKGFILTSNRDERSYRATIAPMKYQFDESVICYPKDEMAGGSWIAMNNKGRVVCLLNGAFIPHTKEAHHTLSRGKVLLLAAQSPVDPDILFTTTSLINSEPFTLLTIDQKKCRILSFNELVWDGSDKHTRQLDHRQSYIWSSVTLYSESDRKERKSWFSQFLKLKKFHPTALELIDFHTTKHSADQSVNLVMERDENLKTVSITQIVCEAGKLEMNYSDLINQSNHSEKL
jgi:hypothetical protein